MKKTPIKLIIGTSIVLLCCFAMSCQRGKSTLKYEPPSQSPLANIYPNTPAGQRVKEHVQAAMGNGENAEAAYQESLTKLRAEPGAAEALIETYRKVPKEYYMLRTMLTEGLKELRSPAALPLLAEIAKERIPPDAQPENTEIDTRTDEVVIRITAVEGISLLAANGLEPAQQLLFDLTGHDDLTVRQMAARGYLQSPLVNAEEKLQTLRRKLPESEHWYLTTKTTDIKQVQHPDMPKEFNLPTKTPTDAPQVKKP